MNIYAIVFLGLSHLFFACLTHADTVKDSRLWLTYTMEHLLSERWKVSMQVQPYWRNEGHTFDQVTYRPGIYYQVNQQWMLGSGYAFAEGYQPNHQRTHENRLWEDVNYQFEQISFAKLSLRTRIEHRQFEHKAEVLHSIRQMIKMTAPITNQLGVVVSDEFYANLNGTNNARRGTDQNRLFAGMSYRVMSATVIELGYMNQYVTRVGGDTDNHILSFTLNQRF